MTNKWGFLKVGRQVNTDFWGPLRRVEVVEIVTNAHCQTGIVVRVKGYESFLDAAWFQPLEESNAPTD